MNTDTNNQFRFLKKEKLPLGILFLFCMFLLGGWATLAALLIGFLIVWPFREKLWRLFNANRTWEKELFVLVSTVALHFPFFFLLQAVT